MVLKVFDKYRNKKLWETQREGVAKLPSCVGWDEMVVRTLRKHDIKIWSEEESWYDDWGNPVSHIHYFFESKGMDILENTWVPQEDHWGSALKEELFECEKLNGLR